MIHSIMDHLCDKKFLMGGGQGSKALSSAQALFDIAARAQTLFDLAAQRSDPLLPLSAPPFCHQRSALIPNFGSPLSAQDLH